MFYRQRGNPLHGPYIIRQRYINDENMKHDDVNSERKCHYNQIYQ